MANEETNPENQVLTEQDANLLKYEHGEYYRGIVDSPAYERLLPVLNKTNPDLVRAVADLKYQHEIVNRMVEAINYEEDSDDRE